jgi:hypothetical protein
MDLMRAKNRRRRGFRQAEVPHPAGGDELGHYAYRLFNGIASLRPSEAQ